MTLSVVIPVYGPWPAARVLAALQPLAALEIIVVDSSPTPTPLPTRPDLRLLHLPQRAYPGAARNAGWQIARGDYLLFVDADVQLTASACRFVLAHMAAGAEDMAFGLYSPRTDGDNALTRIVVAMQRYRFGSEFDRHPVRYGQSSHLLLPRRLYARLGHFNPHLRIHEDKELCIRAAQAGIAVNTYPAFEAEHRKLFSWPALLRDHFDKSWQAMRCMVEYPALFGRVSNQFGRAYKATLISAFATPVALLLLGLTQWLPPAAVAIGLLLNLLLPLALCREVFNQLHGRDTVTALLAWPLIGATVSAGAGLAWPVTRARRLGRGLRSLPQLARIGLRVLRRRGLPVAIVHFITARCNLRCAHCFYKETLDAKDPGEQSLAQLDKTSREIGPLLWYALAGGEPFLRQDLPAIRRLIDRNCRPLMFTIPTNGWYTERTLLGTLAMLQQPGCGPLTVQVSVDGPAALHDAIRGAGSWDRLCDTLAMLRGLQTLYPQLSVGIITVVNADNRQVYPEFIDQLVNDFRPNQISINLVRGNSVHDAGPAAAVVDAWQAAVSRYEWHLARRRLPRLSYFGGRVVRAKEAVQKRLIYRVAGEHAFVTPCTAGTLIYTLWEDGRVNACEMLPDRIGNILAADSDGDFRRIVQGPAAQALRRRIRDTQCKCSYECAMSVNSLFSPGMGRQLLGAWLRGRR